MAESNLYNQEKFDAFIKEFIFKRKNEEYGIFNELKTNLKKYEMFKTKDDEKVAWRSYERCRSSAIKEQLFNHYVIMILFYTHRFLNLYSSYTGSYYKSRYSHDEIHLLVLEYVWVHAIDTYKIESGISFATFLYNTIMHKMKFFMSCSRNNTLIGDITFNGAMRVLAYMMKYDENKTFNEIFCSFTDGQFKRMFSITKKWCTKFLGSINSKVCKNITDLNKSLHIITDDENLTVEDVCTIEQIPYLPYSYDEDGTARAKELAKEIFDVLDRRSIGSKRVRKMWKLHYINGYSVEEISNVFKLERHNCATQISNINRKLRKQLSKEYFTKVA